MSEIEFQKQCDVCLQTNWCKLNGQMWVCMACIEAQLEYYTMYGEEE